MPTPAPAAARSRSTFSRPLLHPPRAVKIARAIYANKGRGTYIGIHALIHSHSPGSGLCPRCVAHDRCRRAASSKPEPRHPTPDTHRPPDRLPPRPHDPRREDRSTQPAIGRWPAKRRAAGHGPQGPGWGLLEPHGGRRDSGGPAGGGDASPAPRPAAPRVRRDPRLSDDVSDPAGRGHYNTVDVSDRTLREISLPPFRAAVDAGVGSIMTSFNEIAGVPSTANHWLLTTLLRDEWRYPGFVVSDWTAIAELQAHGVAGSPGEAGKLALEAGVDMDMGGRVYLDDLPALGRAGRIRVAAPGPAARRRAGARGGARAGRSGIRRPHREGRGDR